MDHSSDKSAKPADHGHATFNGKSPSEHIAHVGKSVSSGFGAISQASQNMAAPIKNSLPDMSLPTPAPLKKRGRLKNLIANFKSHWHKWSKKRRAATVAGCLLVLAGIGFGLFILLHDNKPNTSTQTSTKTVAKKPTTVASPLTGMQVAPALAKRPVTGVMIENSQDARPQSGIQDAGVIIEAIAEGGITRFMNLYQETTPQYVGPVRSLRPYYLDFAAPFQASIVHVGGSPDALTRVRSGGYRDLDQFFNSDYFSRVSSRAAPHNVYTSFDKLDKLNQSKGYTTSTFTSWPRKAESKIAVPTATSIDVAISSYLFNVHYDYDAATNTYPRSEGGAPHMNIGTAGDKTGIRLAPKVVVVLVMAYGINSDGQHSDYQDTGTGNAYIFQDGGVTVGKWAKASADAQISFTDTAGAALKLNPGQTWVTLLGSDSAVTYTAPAPPAATAQ